MTGYATTATTYANLGWHPLPIPNGKKASPPTGSTGGDGCDPGPDDIEAWALTQPDANIAIRLPNTVLGIDVDHYDTKRGADTLTALEADHGPLPPTWSSTSRGPDQPSRISFYRIPAGTRFPGALGRDIEAIQRHHRYAVVNPSTRDDTGGTYHWYQPDGQVARRPPHHDELAELPTRWITALAIQPTSPQPATSRRQPLGDDSIAQHVNDAHHWHDLLNQDGWQLQRHQGPDSHWTRPGKDPRHGTSGVLHGPDGPFVVFTTSVAELQQHWAATKDRSGWAYSKFGYIAATRHQGDRSECARQARRHMNTATPTAAGTDSNGHDDPEPADGDGPPRARPAIVHNGRQLADVTHDAITALHHNNQPPHLFQRAGQLVRLRHDEHHRPLIETLRTDHARTALSHAATWWRITKDGDRTGTSPPVEIANAILAATTWPMPPLTGVVEAPVLRPDGTFHTEHGHDPTTGLYHWHTGHPYPHIPDTPTRQQLTDATNLIDELLCDFPWDTTADRANTWALLLTPLTRPIIGQVPMALIDAPEPGTGKGLLVKACSIVTTGHAAALMAWPATDEELEKKITATLMAGHTVVVFDNVEGMIRSPTLAAVLTADTWQGRVLGRSEMTTVPQRATWAATGNNIDVGGDLARRCYRIRLDARQAQPWLRTGFRHPDLETWATHNRHQLLHALCTIIRSWVAAGRPLATTLPAMGGYSSWVQTIGGILHHAGINDFLANLADFHATADREAASWEAFLAAWNDEYGEQAITVGELVARIRDTIYGANLRGALPDDLVDDIDRPQFTKRLGHALRKRCGRHYGADGRHLVEMPRDRRRVAIYAVTTRSIRLFEPDLADQQTRDVDEIPRDSSALTRDDADDRGIAGSLVPTPHEKSYPQDQKTGAATTPQDPAIPRPNHETPGHTTEPPRGISTTSRAHPIPATDDIEDPFT